MEDIVAKKLDEICEVVNGEWYRTIVSNSRGETGGRIIISYSNPDASGSDSRRHLVLSLLDTFMVICT